MSGRPSIEFFVAGECVHPEHVVLRTGGLARMRFPSMFAALRHPRHGVVLFDTGYTQRFLDATRRFPERLYAMTTPTTIAAEATAAAQLAARGIAASEVRAVVISHFHADHIAGLADFTNAEFVHHPAAYGAVRRLGRMRALAAGFLRALVPADFDRRSRPLDLRATHALPESWGPLGAFGAGIDFFEDGSVYVIDLPGHAAGHVGLLVHDDLGRRLFLVGDACWSMRSLDERRMPHAVTRLLLTDWAAYGRTLTALAALRAARPDVQIVPSHCAPTLAALVGAPAR